MLKDMVGVVTGLTYSNSIANILGTIEHPLWKIGPKAKPNFVGPL